MNRIFIPGINENVVNFRNPSSANFYIDSLNRTTDISGESSTNFTISSNQSLLNGFFTRLGMTEIVLDWAVPNISVDLSNNLFTIVYNTNVVKTIIIADGLYDIENILETIKNQLNAGSTGITFTIVQNSNDTNKVYLVGDAVFSIVETKLSRLLRFTQGDGQPSPVQLEHRILEYPDLLTNRYIDFVCNNLTNNQKVKDGSTAPVVYDTIYRWYFAWDNTDSSVDGLGFTIKQGYNAFTSRRYLSFPKQINWAASQPIGNLNFLVYNSSGNILAITGPSYMEFSMNLLVSEI